MKKIIIPVVLLGSIIGTILLAATVLPVYSQQPPICIRGNCGGKKAPVSGIVVLAIVGGGYAIKKLFDKNKA